MKKISSIALICFLLSVPVLAQVEFGMMGGINFNAPKVNAINTGGSTLNDVGSNGFGFHIGLYATVELELFSIQPEVYYSVQGGKFKINTTQEHDIKMSFIQIPLLGRYNFLNYFHVLVGPQFGIPIQSEIAYASGSPVDIKSQTKGMELSAVLGIGLNLPDIGISGSLRWVPGLTEMIDGVADNRISSLKNSMVQISAAYAFGNN